MENIAEKVLPIIRSTRDMSLPLYGKVEVVAHKDESPNSVVTKVDRDVEEYLKAEFYKIDPTIEFAGEEFGGSRDHKRLWLVDPIDGTLHFVRGMPFCTTMVALIEDGQVTFSAIYDFIHDVMYHAEKGKGAYENGVRISVSDRPINQSVVILETNQSKPGNMEIRNKVREKSAILQMMTAGYE